MSILLSKAHDGLNRLMFGPEARNLKTAFYELIDKDMFSKEVPMSKYKVSKLSDEFKSQGLRILCFPCNQFGGQELPTHQEIVEFTKTIDPEIPEKLEFFEKADVNGAKTREVFSFLKEELPNDDGTTGIRWNFAKFLVDHEGTPYRRYGPTTNPVDCIPDIKDLLKRRNGE